MSKEINYDNYIESRIKKEEPAMTRTQMLFTQELFKNEQLLQIMSAPGDLQGMFNSVQKYLKGR